MRIVLIDDTSDREKLGFPTGPELSVFAGVFEQLIKDDLDVNNLENLDVIKDSNCVIFHSSLNNAFISRILSLSSDVEIPYIQVTGGANYEKYDADEMSGIMDKKKFYRSLISFLSDCASSNTVSDGMLEKLVQGDYCLEKMEAKSTLTDVRPVSMKQTKDPVKSKSDEIQELIDYSPFMDDDYSSQDKDNVTSSAEDNKRSKSNFNGTRRWVNHINDFIRLLRSSAGDVVIGFNVDKVGAAEARNAALYIRLAIDKSKKVAFAPILFYGSGPVIEYIRNFADWSSTDILFCGGSHLIGCVDGRPENPGSYSGLTASTYRREFLRKIKVTPNEETAGNHSIANYWGAYVLGKAICKGSAPQTPQKEELKKLLDRVRDEREPLYLYYLVAQGRTDEELAKYARDMNPTVKNVNNICKNTGKILFIDDQSEIWTPVLHYLLPNATIDVVGKDLLTPETLRSEMDVMEFVACLGEVEMTLDTSFSDDIMSKLSAYSPIKEYDVVILDLRLMGDSEENEQGENLSGLMMLRALMKVNPGLRVIMFTSSNKAWNLGLALEYGAVGYYMKESPGVIVTSAESSKAANKLISTLNYCFETIYLRDMVAEKVKLENNRGRLFDDDTLNAMFAQVEIAFNMLFAAAKTKKIKDDAAKTKRIKDYEYAYIAFEQVFEIIKQLYKNPKKVETWFAVEDTTGLDVSEYTNFRNDIIHNPQDVRDEEELVKMIKNIWELIQVILALDVKIESL